MPLSTWNMASSSSVIYSVFKHTHAHEEKTPPKLNIFRSNQQFWLIEFGVTQQTRKCPSPCSQGQTILLLLEKNIKKSQKQERFRLEKSSEQHLPGSLRCAWWRGCPSWAAAKKECTVVKARIYWRPRFVLFSWKQKDCFIFANRNRVCG